MLYKTFILVFLLIGTPSLNDDAISWKDGQKLTWDHFRGKPNTNISAAAVTASGITFEFSIQETKTRIVNFDTKVYAHFYPEKSWYIKALGDKHILAHEQLHFDITELYARKFRKEISKLKISNQLKDQLRNLHQKINKELATAQNLYDTETDNSIIKEAQERWEIHVKKELAKLDAFKSKE
jgi:hypothetical protein